MAKKRTKLEPSNPQSAWEWKAPLGLLTFGIVVLATRYSKLDLADGVPAWILLPLVVLVHVPIAIGAMYFAAAMLDVSFGYLRTAILKLASIAVLNLAIAEMGNQLEAPPLGLMLALPVSYVLFKKMFDLDPWEAISSVAVILGVRYLIAIVLIGLLSTFGAP